MAAETALRAQGFTDNQRRKALERNYRGIVFEEGALIETNRKIAQRSSLLRKFAIKHFKDKDDAIQCEGCGFRAEALDAFGPPACYLDFEAMMPPIPLYEGTRPYQTIPFQWSLHTINGDGALNHKEFLADGVNDPRRQFAETLVDALARADDPIIVYSAYEQTRLEELAANFLDLSTALNNLIARLADLLPIVRSAIYFPEFGFSNSIKSVAPALCPGFSYDDLEGVADGGAASAAFLQLASGHITHPEEADHLRAALLAYCKRDTLALVEVHRALARMVLP